MLHAETGNTSCEEVTTINTSGDEDNSARAKSDVVMFESGEDETDDFADADRKVE